MRSSDSGLLESFWKCWSDFDEWRSRPDREPTFLDSSDRLEAIGFQLREALPSKSMGCERELRIFICGRCPSGPDRSSAYCDGAEDAMAAFGFPMAAHSSWGIFWEAEPSSDGEEVPIGLAYSVIRMVVPS